MKRILIFSTLIVAAFVALTLRTDWGQRRLFREIRSTSAAWTEPDTAHLA